MGERARTTHDEEKKGPDHDPKLTRQKLLGDLTEIKQVEYLAGFGLNIGEIADFFGMARSTLYVRMAQFPDIQKAIQTGKVNAKLRLIKTAYEKAIKGDNDMIKYLGSRVFGLKETLTIERPDDSTVQMSDEELLIQIEDLRRRNERFQSMSEQKLLPEAEKQKTESN